jgi:hypothetical protein
MPLALFIEAETNASTVIDPLKVRMLRELPDVGLEPRTEIVFDSQHIVIVKLSLRDTWKALDDAKGT